MHSVYRRGAGTTSTNETRQFDIPFSSGRGRRCGPQGLATFCDVGSTDRSLDESAIRSVIDSLGRAWRSGDGSAWGSCFIDDADFTTWFGLRLSGRDAISSGHQEIFKTFYANTAYDLRIDSVRFLSDEIALVALEGSVVEVGEDEPSTPQTVPLAVMSKGADGWKVAAFQNTYAGEVETRRIHGDLREK